MTTKGYTAVGLAKVDALLTGQAPAAERLINYFRYWSETQDSALPYGKCLVVKLGAKGCELAAFSINQQTRL
ncbi:hypothetical protein [Rahnella sp. PCH160]|uniref:hypothetical protein n=1 Tax=Rahnella sp. PCH160 TaxID=3447928 RepID=UPI0039FD87BE